MTISTEFTDASNATDSASIRKHRLSLYIAYYRNELQDYTAPESNAGEKCLCLCQILDRLVILSQTRDFFLAPVEALETWRGKSPTDSVMKRSTEPSVDLLTVALTLSDVLAPIRQAHV